LLPGIVRTYAPRGQTPVLRYCLTRDHLAVMSGITPQGQLYTLTREQPLTSVESVIFLCHLRRRLQRDLLVCWDGSPIHRSEVVKSFLAEGGAQFVHLEAMPAYAPELNPDEGVWQHLKNVEMRNLCCNDMPHLSKELNLAVKRLRNKPSLIQSFFAEAGLDI
jgi:transposase